MPRKKTVPIPEEQELTEQTGLPADTGGMEAEAAPETGMTDFSPSDDPFSGGDAGVWEEGGGDVPHDDADGGIAPADPEPVTEEEPQTGAGWPVMTALGLAALAAGVGGTYFVMKRKERMSYEETADNRRGGADAHHDDGHDGHGGRV